MTFVFLLRAYGSFDTYTDIHILTKCMLNTNDLVAVIKEVLFPNKWILCVSARGYSLKSFAVLQAGVINLSVSYDHSMEINNRLPTFECKQTLAIRLPEKITNSTNRRL